MTPEERYRLFLDSKRQLAKPCGFSVPSSAISERLLPFQRDILKFDLELGKAANFVFTGGGKGPVALFYCGHVSEYAGGDTLIAAPLAVAQQFKREAVKFNVDVTLCKEQSNVKRGINITNYDRLHLFDLNHFVGFAGDESGILKSFTSKTTKTLTEKLANTPYKLLSSATPSPNDHAELGTHIEILDVMTRSQMLAVFFEHDGGDTNKWELKGHGRKPFFRFLASVAVALQRPSDLGYDDAGFDLPPLHTHEHVVPVDHGINTDGNLFRCPDLSATGLHKELRLTCDAKARRVAEIVRAKPHEQWAVWVQTDYEAAAIRKYLPEITEVRGGESMEAKEDKLNAFATGNLQWLLTKPKVAGWGMNFQSCANLACLLGYSFESLFQVIRRFWRYGQTRPVNAHLVMADTEGPIMEALRIKERQYNELHAEMAEAMREEQLLARRKITRYDHTVPMVIPSWLTSEVA